MTATEIIVALGGRLRVAEVTGAKPNAVTQWYKAGIPAKFWPDLLDMPQSKKAGVTVEALRATHKRRAVAAAPASDMQVAV